MAVRLVPARQQSPPPETLLWTVRCGEREAVGLVREWPHSRELVINVDGVLRYGRLHRGDPAALYADSDAKLAQLEAVGWQAE